MSTQSQERRTPFTCAPQPAHWGAVLCVFALIASEFVLVSLLTPMAAELGVSKGMAGQGIAISGAFAVLTSLSISALAGSMDRKKALTALTAIWTSASPARCCTGRRRR